MMCILRTADCFDNELLTQFYNIVSNRLSTMLNYELSGDQILQASLPVKTGGLDLPQLFLAGTIRLLGFCRGDRGTSSYNPSSGRGKTTNRSARFHTKQDVRKMEGHFRFSTTTRQSLRQGSFGTEKLENSLSACSWPTAHPKLIRPVS